MENENNDAKFEVVLSPQYSNALRAQVMTVIKVAVADARQQTMIDSPWLRSKADTAKWLGVSPNTLETLIVNGLPIHYLPGTNRVVAQKQEVSAWLLQQ